MKEKKTSNVQGIRFSEKEQFLLDGIAKSAEYNKRSISSQIKFMLHKYAEWHEWHGVKGFDGDLKIIEGGPPKGFIPYKKKD